MSKLTISIVAFNGVGKIEACLQSLHEQSFSDYDIVVVDNASSDGTIATVTNLTPEARIIALHENVGFGAGHNIVLREATTPFVLVLNQDVVLEPDALQHLVNAAEHSGAAVTGPLLLRPNPGKEAKIVDTAGITKSWWWSVKDRRSGKTLVPSLSRSGFIWGISGACMLLRREALDAIAYDNPSGKQYFDEAFFMYKEDIDLCARLRRVGQNCWYEAAAKGWHSRTGKSAETGESAASHRRRLPAYVREYSYRNHWLLIIKHAWIIQWPLILVYELLKLVWVLVTEPKTLRLVPDIFRLLPIMLKRRYA